MNRLRGFPFSLFAFYYLSVKMYAVVFTTFLLKGVFMNPETVISKEKHSEACGEECQIFSRVCGYYRPVSNWNRGKQEEFKERKEFELTSPSCGK